MSRSNLMIEDEIVRQSDRISDRETVLANFADIISANNYRNDNFDVFVDTVTRVVDWELDSGSRESEEDIIERVVEDVIRMQAATLAKRDRRLMNSLSESEEDEVEDWLDDMDALQREMGQSRRGRDRDRGRGRPNGSGRSGISRSGTTRNAKVNARDTSRTSRRLSEFDRKRRNAVDDDDDSDDTSSRSSRRSGSAQRRSTRTSTAVEREQVTETVVSEEDSTLPAIIVVKGSEMDGDEHKRFMRHSNLIDTRGRARLSTRVASQKADYLGALRSVVIDLPEKENVEAWTFLPNQFLVLDSVGASNTSVRAIIEQVDDYLLESGRDLAAQGQSYALNSTLSKVMVKASPATYRFNVDQLKTFTLDDWHQLLVAMATDTAEPFACAKLVKAFDKLITNRLNLAFRYMLGKSWSLESFLGYWKDVITNRDIVSDDNLFSQIQALGSPNHPMFVLRGVSFVVGTETFDTFTDEPEADTADTPATPVGVNTYMVDVPVKVVKINAFLDQLDICVLSTDDVVNSKMHPIVTEESHRSLHQLFNTVICRNGVPDNALLQQYVVVTEDDYVINVYPDINHYAETNKLQFGIEIN